MASINKSDSQINNAKMWNYTIYSNYILINPEIKQAVLFCFRRLVARMDENRNFISPILKEKQKSNVTAMRKL